MSNASNLFASKDAFNIHRMPYANLMRVGDVSGYGQSSEFSLQSEDFPALPGATAQQQQQNSLNAGSNQTNQSESHLLSSGHTNFGQQHFSSSNTTDLLTNGTNENGREMKGIQVGPDGMVTNIPPGMLCDQYGMAGLVSFLRSVETKESPAATLCVGFDILKMGLNLSASEKNLYQTFGGPWSEAPCRVQDADVKVPDEYLTNGLIRDKLPQIKVNKLSEDVLFYIFYNCPGQVYQLAAAKELYTRDWRYHKLDGVWLTRSVFGTIKEQTSEYEKGSYNIFDPIQWRKIPKEMTLEYKVLEDKTSADPTAMLTHRNPNAEVG